MPDTRPTSIDQSTLTNRLPTVRERHPVTSMHSRSCRASLRHMHIPCLTSVQKGISRAFHRTRGGRDRSGVEELLKGIFPLRRTLILLFASLRLACYSGAHPGAVVLHQDRRDRRPDDEMPAAVADQLAKNSIHTPQALL